MEEKYFEGLKSQIADFKNTGPRGGSITAALFLKQFVKETPGRISTLPVQFGLRRKTAITVLCHGLRRSHSGELGIERQIWVAAHLSRNAHMYPVETTKDTLANSKKTISGSRVGCPPY